MINKIYSEVFSSKKINIGDEKSQLTLFVSRNKIVSCPRMLEYSLSTQDAIDFSLNNDRKKYFNFFTNITSLNKTLTLYSYGDSLLFKCMPEYFKNENNKVLNLDFITNVQILDLSKFDSFTDYLNILSKKRRYKVKKALEKGMDIKLATDDSDFIAFAEMHIKQWKEKGDPSVLENKDWYSFYHKAFESKALVLHKLQLGDKIVAYHLGFIKEGVFQYLMPTYSSDYAGQSPGFILLIGLINNCFSQGVKTFNFGSGEYEYKMWLSNYSRPVFKVTIKRSKLLYNVKKTLITLKPIMKSMMKRFSF